MKIIAALDGSPRQAGVLQEALRMAQARHAELHLCRAMQVPLSLPSVVWSLKGDDFNTFLVEHGEQELRAVAQEHPTVKGVHCRLGQPSDVICTLAGELGAELVILGTHGFDGVDRLLGTTASKVVNRAPCSVLVVRERA